MVPSTWHGLPEGDPLVGLIDQLDVGGTPPEPVRVALAGLVAAAAARGPQRIAAEVDRLRTVLTLVADGADPDRIVEAASGG